MTQARSWFFILSCLLCLLLVPKPGRAFVLPDSVVDPNQFATVANQIVTSIGLMAEHRSYESATPLGTQQGMVLGVELTLIKPPEDLFAALSSMGEGVTEIPAVPIPKLHLHKGLGSRVSTGFSLLWIQKYRVYGGNFTVTLAQPPEGLTWAMRLNYTYSKIDFVTTQTLTPQLLISKKMEFADPYLGLGYSYVTGKIKYPLEVSGISLGELVFQGKGHSFMAFTGVSFTQGLRLSLEGGFSAAGAHTLGVLAGFSF